MSHRVLSRAISRAKTTESHTMRRMVATLALFQDDNAWRSSPAIAEAMQCVRDQANHVLRVLHKAGLVERRSSGKANGGLLWRATERGLAADLTGDATQLPGIQSAPAAPALDAAALLAAMHVPAVRPEWLR